MVRVAIAVLLTLAGGATVASGHPLENAGTMLKACKQPLASYEQTVCLGFVAGTGGSMIMTSTVMADNRPFLDRFGMCEAPKVGDMIEAFVLWAEANPQLVSRSATFGVMAALQERWPCFLPPKKE